LIKGRIVEFKDMFGSHFVSIWLRVVFKKEGLVNH